MIKIETKKIDKNKSEMLTTCSGTLGEIINDLSIACGNIFADALNKHSSLDKDQLIIDFIGEVEKHLNRSLNK